MSSICFRFPRSVWLLRQRLLISLLPTSNPSFPRSVIFLTHTSTVAARPSSSPLLPLYPPITCGSSPSSPVPHLQRASHCRSSPSHHLSCPYPTATPSPSLMLSPALHEQSIASSPSSPLPSSCPPPAACRLLPSSMPLPHLLVPATRGISTSSLPLLLPILPFPRPLATRGHSISSPHRRPSLHSLPTLEEKWSMPTNFTDQYLVRRPLQPSHPLTAHRTFTSSPLSPPPLLAFVLVAPTPSMFPLPLASLGLRFHPHTRLVPFSNVTAPSSNPPLLYFLVQPSSPGPSTGVGR